MCLMYVRRDNFGIYLIDTYGFKFILKATKRFIKKYIKNMESEFIMVEEIINRVEYSIEIVKQKSNVEEVAVGIDTGLLRELKETMPEFVDHFKDIFKEFVCFPEDAVYIMPIDKQTKLYKGHYFCSIK